MSHKLTNYPFKEQTSLQTSTRMKLPSTAKKSTCAPTLKPSGLRTAMGSVIWPLLFTVAIGMSDYLRLMGNYRVIATDGGTGETSSYSVTISSLFVPMAHI